jgi:hypothetical protein
MTIKTRFFVGVTILPGICLVVFCLTQMAGAVTSSAYLVWLALASISSALKVHLPGIHGTISVNFLFVLVSIALFTFPETVLLAAVAGIFQCLWRPKSRPRSVQVSFSVATLAISSGASYRLSHVLAGSPAGHLAVLMAVAASFYFTANTLLVSGVLSLVQGKSLSAVWQQCYLWSFPYYLAGAAVAGLAVATNESAGWLTSLLLLPVMYLIYVFYKICVERAGARSAVPTP